MASTQHATADQPADQSSLELVYGLRRFLPTIAFASLVGAVVSLLVFLILPPRYTSEASIVLESLDDSASTRTVNMATERQIASSTAVADAVIHDLRLDESPEDVLGELSVSVPVDTSVLVLSYTASDPALAQRRAQAFADAYLALRRQEQGKSTGAASETIRARIDALRADLSALAARAASETDPARRAALQVSANSVMSQISIQEQALSSQSDGLAVSSRELTAASRPRSPSGPTVVVIVMVGLFVGAVAGTLFVLARSLLGRLRTADGFAEAVGAPVLAQIPRPRRANRDSPILVPEDAPVADAYRRLVMHLLASGPTAQPRNARARSIAIVGVGEGSKSSTLVANLGVAMALTGRDVVLVSGRSDGNLETIFDTPPIPGITEVIRHEAAMREAVRSTWLERLRVVPVGSDDGSWALLDTDAVRRAIQQMGSETPMVLLDTPRPTAGETGALVAACDEVLIAVSLGTGSSDEVRRVRMEFETLGTSCIGIVALGHTRSRGRRRARRDAERRRALSRRIHGGSTPSPRTSHNGSGPRQRTRVAERP